MDYRDLVKLRYNHRNENNILFSKIQECYETKNWSMLRILTDKLERSHKLHRNQEDLMEQALKEE